MFEQLEQQAAGARAGAEASPVPARQLTFTPTTAGLQAAGAPAAAGATPLSSAGRSSHQPTSHLGRSALRQAAAAAPAGEDAELVGPPEQGQVQPPLALGLGQQAAVPLSAAHEKQQLQLDGPLLQPPVQAGHKRSLAAAAALEKVAAQYSPAAAKLQQDQLLAAASTQDGPVWKRLRSAESAQEQQSLLHQDQQEAAGGRPRAALPQAPTQDGHTAAAVDTLASFEYCALGLLVEFALWFRTAFCLRPCLVVVRDPQPPSSPPHLQCAATTRARTRRRTGTCLC